MTYCVAVRVDQGLVMLSDTRTNAGMDNIARFRKSFTYLVEGERAITLLCSGNLSITQGVKATLSKAIKDAKLDPDIET
ncbi:MAG: peptidase, partial [Alphaproteobacteria bacterium]|nr:peptidase [Alphaproteobacteria bacterium]